MHTGRREGLVVVTGVNLEGSGEVAEWDWIITLRGDRLHAPQQWEDPHYDASDEHAQTACGRSGWYMIPGVFARMGCDRCKRCCALRGYPEGKGSPKNDDTCRPLVKARLAALQEAAHA